MKKKWIPVFIICLICSCAKLMFERGKGQSVMSINLIPKPLDVHLKEGHVTLTPETQIVVESTDPEAREVGQYLSDKIHLSSNFSIPVKVGTIEGDDRRSIALIQSDVDKKSGEEGYVLDVRPQRITVKANSPTGLFYGVQTLLQLLPPDIYSNDQTRTDVDWVIPCVHISDKPRYTWRGMHLDVCRHFFTKEFIKTYLDYLAYHKMNVFHWHLTEDQGWRIEIKKYPKLTEVGAWRADRSGITWRERKPQQAGEQATYGGYYTQEDVREIIEYARQRFITIVPEIELPGHAVAALAAYPQYSCTGGPFTVITGGYWPISDVYCAGSDSTFFFLENILTEVMDLFPGKYIHIGGDEVNKANWANCLKCQKRIEEEGLKDEDELQSYFVKRIEKIVNAKGKKIIGWDEILEGGLAPDAAVMSWRGMEGGINAARMGHDVVMSPKTYCYFDYYQRDPRDEPEAIGGFLPLEKVYEFEPTPEDLTSEQAAHILGGQGNLWTEYIPTPAQAEYMLFPRMCALAEVLWSSKKSRDKRDFMNRMNYHYLRLDAMKANYCEPYLTGFDPHNVFIDSTLVEILNPRTYGEIHYTLDGAEPSISSPRYLKPFHLSETTLLKARIYFPDGKISALQQGLFEKCVPLPAVHIENRKPGVRFTYYVVNDAIQSTADLTNYTPRRSDHISHFILMTDEAKEYFGIIYEGFLFVSATGVYKFTTTSDDGSRLFIADRLIVDNDGNHGVTDRFDQIALKAGYHPIRLEYFQGRGNVNLTVFYEGPGLSKREIPPSVLVHTDNR